jgi:hypothetical protein
MIWKNLKAESEKNCTDNLTNFREIKKLKPKSGTPRNASGTPKAFKILAIRYWCSAFRGVCKRAFSAPSKKTAFNFKKKDNEKSGTTSREDQTFIKTS